MLDHRYDSLRSHFTDREIEMLVDVIPELTPAERPGKLLMLWGKNEYEDDRAMRKEGWAAAIWRALRSSIVLPGLINILMFLHWGPEIFSQGMMLFLPVWAVGVVNMVRELVANDYENYISWKPLSVTVICTKLLQHYRQKIVTQKAELVGEGSEYSEKREKLEEALTELRAHRAYWNQQPNSDVRKEAVARCEALESFLVDALASLERQRQEVLDALAQLQGFYEARLAPYEQLTKLEEIDRLDKSAKGIVSEARAHLTRVTADLKVDLQTLHDVMSELERQKLLELEQEGSDTEQIYAMAESIGLAESETQRRTEALLGRLESAA